MLLTIIIFIAVLSLLVFVHELGHFVVAKRSGMKIHEFGFGFPPRVVGIQKVEGKWRVVWGKKNLDADTTVYSINAIPLGGFVRIMGEDNDEAQDPRSFTQKGFFPRFFTLAAGVIMNVITAWLLISIGFMAGLPVAVNDPSDVPSNAEFQNQQVLITQVREDSPAAQAGLAEGDVIIRVDEQEIADVKVLQTHIAEQQGQEIDFTVRRINEEQTITVTTSADSDPAQGIVGIGLAYYGKLQFGPVASLIQGAETTYNQVGAIFTGLYQAFTTSEGIKSLGGPVKIAQLTGQVADLGLIPLIQFAAFLSLNLAILNSLPFPALDGGRILFLIIEKLRGKPNNQAVEQYANAIGFLALLLLMAVITVRDVSQLETIRNLFS